MLFINTRPTERAQSLSNTVRHLNIDLLDLPLLELRAVEHTDTLVELYAKLHNTQVIVVVSPTAAELGLKFLAKSGLVLAQLSHIQWIAVGTATAKTLETQGIHAVVPEVESSEGMLSLPLLQQLSIQRVAFWRGEGGRQFMMQQLQEQGVDVLNFILYTRHLPVKTQQLFAQQREALAQRQQQIYLCISSEASWRNWQNLCHNCPTLLAKCHYLVLGERLYRLISSDLHPNEKNQVCAFTRLAPEIIYQYLLEQKGLA